MSENIPFDSFRHAFSKPKVRSPEPCSKNSPATQVPSYRILVLLAIALALRLTFFNGFTPHLDMRYEPYAHALATGSWQLPQNAPTGRWMVVLPAALAYRILGVNDISSALGSLVASLGTVVTAYLLGQYLAGSRPAFLSGLMVAVFPLEVGFATQLMADSPLSFCLLLTLLFFLKGMGHISGQPDWRMLFVSGLTLGLAWGTKLEAMLVFPFFLLYALFAKKPVLRLGYVIAGFATVVSAEMLVYFVTSQSPFHRLMVRLVESHLTHYNRDAGTAHTAASVIRSFMAFPAWMFWEVHYTGIAFVVLAATFLYILLRKFYTQYVLMWSQLWPLLLWSGLLVFLVTFLPAHTSPYVPAYKIHYYLLLFSAPLLVVLGIILSQLSAKAQMGLLALLILSSGLSTYLATAHHRSLTGNSHAMNRIMKHHPAPVVYTVSFNAYAGNYFDGYQNNIKYIVLQPGDYQGLFIRAVEGIENGHAYAAVDLSILDFPPPLSLSLPAEFRSPPEDWQRIADYQQKMPWLGKLAADSIARWQEKGLIDADQRVGLEQKLHGWVHGRPLYLYRINSKETK